MSQIKSKLRVRELAEVYTNEREINAMLDLVKDYSYDIPKKFFEPACGNGNFLEKILERKLLTIKKRHHDRPIKEFEYQIAMAISNIYGVDICPHNVAESKERMLRQVFDFFYFVRNTEFPTPGFDKVIGFILNKNIVCGNTLEDLDTIFFFDFIPEKKQSFSLKKYSLRSLYEEVPPHTKKTRKPIHYLNLPKWRDR